MKILNNWRIVLLLCLTLGLAPYYPQPHILGKVRWVWKGANNMMIMDWFDLLLHGFPFLLLIRLIFLKIFNQK